MSLATRLAMIEAQRQMRCGRNRRWYGQEASWWVPLERDARRKYGQDLQCEFEADRITYRISLEVRGRDEPVPVMIQFFSEPYYDRYHLRAMDYPRVHSEPGLVSAHRMPSDDALCLYFPWSPPSRRWRSENGLLMLLDLTRDHLFAEEHWRCTGGKRGGTWLLPEAPHGLPQGSAA